MELGLADQLGVKCSGEDAALAGGDGVTVDFGEDFDLSGVIGDPWGADEDGADGLGEAAKVEVSLEATNLPTEGVALGAHVEHAEVF